MVVRQKGVEGSSRWFGCSWKLSSLTVMLFTSYLFAFMLPVSQQETNVLNLEGLKGMAEMSFLQSSYSQSGSGSMASGSYGSSSMGSSSFGSSGSASGSASGSGSYMSGSSSRSRSRSRSRRGSSSRRRSRRKSSGKSRRRRSSRGSRRPQSSRQGPQGFQQPPKDQWDHLQAMLQNPGGGGGFPSGMAGMNSNDIADKATSFFCQCGCALQEFKVDGNFAKAFTDTQRGPKFGAKVRAIPITKENWEADYQSLLDGLPLQKLVKHQGPDGNMQLMEYAAIGAIEAPPLLSPEQRKKLLDYLSGGEYNKLEEIQKMIQSPLAKTHMMQVEESANIDVTMTEPRLMIQEDPESARMTRAEKITSWNRYCELVCYSDAFLAPHVARSQNHIEYGVMKRGDDPYRHGRMFSDEPLHIGYVSFNPAKNEAEEEFVKKLMLFANEKKKYWYELYTQMATLGKSKNAEFMRMRGGGGGQPGGAGGFGSGSSAYGSSAYGSGSSAYGGSSALSSMRSRMSESGFSSGFDSGFSSSGSVGSSGYDSGYSSESGSGSMGASSMVSSSASMLQLGSYSQQSSAYGSGFSSGYGSGDYGSQQSYYSQSQSYPGSSQFSSYGSYGSEQSQSAFMDSQVNMDPQSFSAPVMTWECDELANTYFAKVPGEPTTWAELANTVGIARDPKEIYPPGKVPEVYLEGEAAAHVGGPPPPGMGGPPGMGPPPPPPPAQSHMGAVPLNGEPVPLFANDAPAAAPGGGGGAGQPDEPILLVKIDAPEMYPADPKYTMTPEKEVTQWLKTKARTPAENWPKTNNTDPNGNVLAIPVTPMFRMKATLVRNPQDGVTRVSKAFFGRRSTSVEGMFEFLNFYISAEEREKYLRHHNEVLRSWLVPVMDKMFGKHEDDYALRVGEAFGDVEIISGKARGKVQYIGHEHAQAPAGSVPTQYIVDHSMDMVRTGAGYNGPAAAGSYSGGGSSQQQAAGPRAAAPAPAAPPQIKLNFRHASVDKPYDIKGGASNHWVQRLPGSFVELGSMAQNAGPGAGPGVHGGGFIDQETVAKFDMEYKIGLYEVCWTYMGKTGITNDNRVIVIAEPERLFVSFNNGDPPRAHAFSGIPPHVVQAFSGDGLLRVLKDSRPDFENLMKDYHPKMYKVLFRVLKNGFKLGHEQEEGTDLFKRNTCPLLKSEVHLTMHSHATRDMFQLYDFNRIENFTQAKMQFGGQEMMNVVGSLLNRCYGRTLPSAIMRSTKDPTKNWVCVDNPPKNAYAVLLMPALPRAGGGPLPMPPPPPRPAVPLRRVSAPAMLPPPAPMAPQPARFAPRPQSPRMPSAYPQQQYPQQQPVGMPSESSQLSSRTFSQSVQSDLISNAGGSIAPVHPSAVIKSSTSYQDPAVGPEVMSAPMSAPTSL